MMKGRIHSYESLGTVDGPGTRFVVFFQGCPMRCLYCHNPDTWDTAGGTLASADEVLDKYDSVKEFISGGITATGGEPLMQFDFLYELFSKAKKRGIHTCIDTSGILYTSNKKADFKKLFEVCDLIMLDIKHIDSEKHKKLTGHSNENILEFAKFISDTGTDLWIRHVVVPGITDNEDDWYKLGIFLSELKTLKAIDVLPYHTMGKAKYSAMGLDYPLKDVKPLEKDVAIRAKKIIIDGIKHGIRKRNKTRNS